MCNDFDPGHTSKVKVTHLSHCCVPKTKLCNETLADDTAFHACLSPLVKSCDVLK